MKRFACGDVVPGCSASWVCDSEDELFAAVAAHALVAHDLSEIDDELVEAVRTNIHAVSA